MIVLQNGSLLFTPRPAGALAEAPAVHRNAGRPTDGWAAVHAGLASLDERIALAGHRFHSCRFTLQHLHFQLEWMPFGQMSWGRHLLSKLRCLLLGHHGRLTLRVRRSGMAAPCGDAAARQAIEGVRRAAAGVRRRRQKPEVCRQGAPGLHCPDVERVFSDRVRKPLWHWLRWTRRHG
ncbi:hypothetical protein [Paracidovorax citrulli]